MEGAVQALPPPLQVLCGHCGLAIWAKLESYLLVGAQQAHIHSEDWTNVPPDMSALSPHPDDAVAAGRYAMIVGLFLLIVGLF